MRALEVDLLGEVGPTHKADTLFYVSQAFRRRPIDELWRGKTATSAKSLGMVVTSDTATEQILKELRRQTGHNMDQKELSETHQVECASPRGSVTT